MRNEMETGYYEHLPAKFTQTDWTGIVVPAGKGDMDALNLLAHAYWYPLYWHARRKGLNEHDAEDVVQAFFAHLLANSGIKNADRKRGKFRTFLLTALRNYLVSEWRKRQHIPILISVDELREKHGDDLLPEVEDNLGADFYRDWGLTLLNLALQRLEEEQHASGKGELFNHLKGHLAGAKDLTGLSETIGIPVNTLKSDLRRLRKGRLPELIEEEVRRTLCDPTDEEVRQELLFIKHHAAGAGAG